MKGHQNGHAADAFPRVRKFLSRTHEKVGRQSLPEAAADTQQKGKIQME